MTIDRSSGSEADAPAVDVRVLAELVGPEPEVIAEFLGQYRSSARSLVADIRAARDAGDLDAIGGAAHKLKSAARAIGARGLGNIAAALEQAAKAGQPAAVESLRSEFDTAVAAVEQALGRYLATS
jgi:HPt (histidine-containing phosphotransfer) domain-containing protein